MWLRLIFMLSVASIMLGACRFGGDIAMSGEGDDRIFSVTSRGGPACVRGLSVYAESDPMRAIWAVRRLDAKNDQSCRNVFALNNVPPGYEIVIPLARPITAGQYRTEASGVGFQATTLRWSVP